MSYDDILDSGSSDEDESPLLGDFRAPSPTSNEEESTKQSSTTEPVHVASSSVPPPKKDTLYIPTVGSLSPSNNTNSRRGGRGGGKGKRSRRGKRGGGRGGSRGGRSNHGGNNGRKVPSTPTETWTSEGPLPGQNNERIWTPPGANYPTPGEQPKQLHSSSRKKRGRGRNRGGRGGRRNKNNNTSIESIIVGATVDNVFSEDTSSPSDYFGSHYSNANAEYSSPTKPKRYTSRGLASHQATPSYSSPSPPVGPYTSVFAPSAYAGVFSAPPSANSNSSSSFQPLRPPSAGKLVNGEFIPSSRAAESFTLPPSSSSTPAWSASGSSLSPYV